MKRIYLLIIIAVTGFAGCRTTKPAAETVPVPVSTPVPVPEVTPPAVNFSEQSTWLLGYFSPDRLAQYPYSAWYIKEFDDYQFNSEAVNKLLDIGKDNLKIKVVLGTWCPDSRREVPRFMRILNIWNFPLTQVSFIGVDNSKQSPVGEYASLKILRVPTFIIYKNNIESGRIIENPVTSLEQDMVNILTGSK